MAFWGVLVKPNEPYILQRDDDDHGNPKRLRISQATLADRTGLWTSRSVVRCAVGSKPPVFICSLSIGEVASCKLDLEFEEKDDVVFSVKGPRGVHLAGYFLNSSGTTSTTLTTDAPKPGLEGKEDIAKTSSDGPSNFNSQDRNTTYIDELEDGAGEYSRIKSVDQVARDANEEHTNEKTKKACEEVDKIHAADRSVVHKCDEVVKQVDFLLGDGGTLNNSCSLEKLLLQENGNVLSPSSNGDEGNNGLRHCGKVKKKKRKETTTECKLVEDDARNASHQAISDKNFETVATDLCPSQDKSLSISPRKNLKEVEVGDGSSEKAGFDLPDDALESHTKLQNGSHSQSKKVKKKKNKVMEDDDTHLDKYIIREKEPFQQEQDQYIVKEGEMEIAKEMATSGSCKREEKSPKRPKVGKRRSGQHDGNPKGGDLGSLDYKEDRAGGGAKDRNQKNELLANNRNQRQNKILDDKKIEVVADGSSASKRKKLTKVRFAEATLGNQELDLPDDVLKSPLKLQNDQGDLGWVYATESVDIGAIKGVDDRKQRQNDNLADATDEQASGLPVSHRKKKKVRMMGEGIVVGEKDLNPQDHPLVSQSKLRNARLHDDNGNALERSHINEMKEKKKKKQDLDDDKHLGKKRKIERNEVVREDATDGSAKETGKSYKKSDVKNVEGDVQDGNT